MDEYLDFDCDTCDDYFETHEQDDLRDWSDNEAWEDALADMREMDDPCFDEDDLVGDDEF